MKTKQDVDDWIEGLDLMKKLFAYLERSGENEND